jgi:hypothetical protein
MEKAIRSNRCESRTRVLFSWGEIIDKLWPTFYLVGDVGCAPIVAGHKVQVPAFEQALISHKPRIAPVAQVDRATDF